MYPSRTSQCQSAGGNDTMDVRMKQEVLTPRMQNTEEADLRAKVFGIRGDLDESLRHDTKQEVVEFGVVLTNERVELVWQAENNMEVSGLEQFPLSSRDPTLPCLGLTLRTVPIPT